jgi:acetylornithine deacetylase/succinyl-diaminopimelate desuccinylase-like protein
MYSPLRMIAAARLAPVGALVGALVGVLVDAGPACAGALNSVALRQMVASYRSAHERQILAELNDLVELRSVAADPHGLAMAAGMLIDALRRRGFDAQLLTTPASPPLVFGEWRAAGTARTVVFYAHYDAQPVTPSQWGSDPFTPVLRKGADINAAAIDWHTVTLPLSPEARLFGRAAADDKASIIAFLAAFDALRNARLRPAVNLKVVWEGEEKLARHIWRQSCASMPLC